MIQQSNELIPPAYKRVEYVIANYSASNFDSGVCGNNDNLRIQICFECGFHSNYYGFFGNHVRDSVNGWRFMASTNDKAFLVNANSRCGSSRSISTPDGNSWLNKKVYADISQPYRAVTIDGNAKVDTHELTISETDNNTNIAIGAHKITSGSVDNTKLTKYYYVRIYDGDKFIRNYIPCYRKSDNKVGFYDTVNCTFNYSQGNAEFTLPT